MIDLILYIIACEALVQLWFYAAPLQGIRNWVIKYTPFLNSEEQGHLFNCKYCTSFWCALFLAIFYFTCPLFKYFIIVLVIHRLSNFLHLIFSYIRDLQLDIRVNRNRQGR
jgi:hypothetical protein